MKTAALVLSLLILLGYVALVQVSPSFGYLSPRGGMFTLGISLIIANFGVWLAGQETRTLNQRFQFAVAAWIWLLVQAACLAYVYVRAVAA